MEIWKEYASGYFGSTIGRVKSLKRGKEKILKAQPDKYGYPVVCLYIDGKRKVCKIHRVVAELFIPNPENKPQVNHINGIKTDNRIENLEWATAAENNLHAFKNGLQIVRQGEDCSWSKFTVEQIVYIRENPDNLNQYQLAEKFGTVQTVISDIQLGKTYKNAGGTIRDKSKRPSAKLTTTQVIYIRNNPDELNTYQLAGKFGIARQTISDIQLGKRYKNVGGSIRGKIKLRTPDEKREKIRELYATGQYTQKQLAEMFNINDATVSRIVNGK